VVKLEDITVFNDIQARLERITAEDIMVAGGRLSGPENGDKDVGEVSEATKALWVLLLLLSIEKRIEGAKSGQLIDKEISNDHAQRSLMASELEDVVKELMWCQARMDTGYWESENVGIREGWRLVTTRSRRGGLGEILAQFGGTLEM
jgi:hypothetical protein